MDDRVTRQVATAVLRSVKVRRMIRGTYLYSALTAVPPEPALDVEVVARVLHHTEMRELRDACLAAILAIALAIVSYSIVVIGCGAWDACDAENDGWTIVAWWVLMGVYLIGCRWLYARWRREVEVELVPMFWEGQYCRDRVMKRFRGRLPAVVSDSLPDEGQDLFVFAGSRPFVGAGFELSSWEVSIDVAKGKSVGGKRQSPLAIDVRDLSKAVVEKFENIRLPGLRSRYVYAIGGLDTGRVPLMSASLIGRAPRRAPSAVADAWANNGELPGRRYLWISVALRRGEVVVSNFVWWTVSGNALLAQCKRVLLPPLRAEYRLVDRDSRVLCDRYSKYTDWVAAVWRLSWSLTRVGEWWRESGRFVEVTENGTAYPVPEGEAIDRFRRARVDGVNRLLEGGYVEFGCGASLREMLCDRGWGDSFERDDAILHFRLFDRLLLDAIEEFLNSRQVDTEDLRERNQTIVNSGIFVAGGDVRADSIAVGQRSSVSVVRRRGKQREGGGDDART
jgi:hypothetical protein